MLLTGKILTQYISFRPVMFSAFVALAELARRAGIPPGVINVIICRPGHAAETTSHILSAPPVRLVTFTGSTKVGTEIAKVAAQRVLRTCFELGGNAPFIIHDDANLDLAIDDLMKVKFRTTGQVCITCNRVYVHDSIYDNVIIRLRPRLDALKRRMGNGLREDVSLGPLTPKRAMGRIEAVVKDAISKGAVVEFGGHRGLDAEYTDIEPPEPIRNGAESCAGEQSDGKRENGDTNRDGSAENDGDEGLASSSWGVKPDNFYVPTLLSNMHDNMDMVSQEIFGPIIPLYRFHTEAEVLDRAGRVTAEDSTGGLAAYVYTRSHARGKRAVRELHVGMVGLNSIYLSDPRTTFGGVGLSGIGREGGPGLEEYCEKKYYVDRYDID
jgi:succinate-semialdehyde dehydrogenase / glutarate-semialdehyde dehydrogenase